MGDGTAKATLTRLAKPFLDCGPSYWGKRFDSLILHIILLIIIGDMKLTLKHCIINNVEMINPKANDNQKKNRKVILLVDEEDFFEMLDSVNPKNIIKYLDMRGIVHREPSIVNVKLTRSKQSLGIRHKIRRISQELDKFRKCDIEI